MSAFEEELRRLREFERQLAPFREAERIRSLLQPGMLSTSELAMIEAAELAARAEEDRKRFALPEFAIRQPTVRLLLDSIERQRLLNQSQFAGRLSPAEEQVIRITEMLERYDLLESLQGAELEQTPESIDLLDDPPPQSQLVVIKEISDELLRELQRDSRQAYKLTPRKFEYLVAELLTRSGYSVEVTSTTRDGGKDVIARMKTPAIEFTLYVECKKYEPGRNVGVEVVRQLFGVVQSDRVSGGLIVTTSGFTKGAYDYRNNIPRLIDLKAHADLTTWLRATK